MFNFYEDVAEHKCDVGSLGPRPFFENCFAALNGFILRLINESISKTLFFSFFFY